jgi:hypothetical protein
MAVVFRPAATRGTAGRPDGAGAEAAAVVTMANGIAGFLPGKIAPLLCETGAKSTEQQAGTCGLSGGPG